MITTILCMLIAAALVLLLVRLAWRLLVDALAEHWLESPAYCDPGTRKPWYVLNYEKYWARRRA